MSTPTLSLDQLLRKSMFLSFSGIALPGFLPSCVDVKRLGHDFFRFFLTGISVLRIDHITSPNILPNVKCLPGAFFVPHSSSTQASASPSTTTAAAAAGATKGTVVAALSPVRNKKAKRLSFWVCQSTRTYPMLPCRGAKRD